MKNEKLKIATRVIHAGQEPDPNTGAVMPPIYASTVYAQPTLESKQKYHYSRVSNPTREAYEKCVADLENGSQGFAFASGVAAIANVLELLNSGDHVIVIDNVYGGSYRLFETVRARSANLNFSYVDMTSIGDIEKAIQPNTKMLWVESPSNPLLTIIDLPAVAQIARKNNLISVIDNTFATPILQQPLQVGFDLVVHSATKYLNGHSDVLNGIVIVGENSELAAKLAHIQMTVGAVPSPADCYAILRGLKTLAIRMERHCSNALTLAEWLEKQPQIEKVYYPGLKSHPQHELAKKQMTAFGGVISVLVKGGFENAKRFVEGCKLFALTGSLGGVESLIGHPVTMSHSSVPENIRLKLGITDNLVRISVGIEDVADLIHDLESALNFG